MNKEYFYYNKYDCTGEHVKKRFWLILGIILLSIGTYFVHEMVMMLPLWSSFKADAATTGVVSFTFGLLFVPIIFLFATGFSITLVTLQDIYKDNSVW